jgi:signal peptidase I
MTQSHSGGPGEASSRPGDVRSLDALGRASTADHVVGPSTQGLLRRLRWGILGTIGLLIGLGLVRASFLTGLWRRVVIEGPSMAPQLCGASLRVVCDDCGFPFACDAEHLPPEMKAVCPNCGYLDNSLRQAAFQPADRVLIDRWPLGRAMAMPGDVVALRLPQAGGELAVKRVVARGGQRVSIRDGDLYLDGVLVRKTRQELAAVQVLVHDNDYQPKKTAGLAPRWQPLAPASRWSARGTRLVFSPPQGSLAVPEDGSPEAFDWLAYVHWPCTAQPRLRQTRSPVLDNDSYNPSLTRPLNAVSDVLFTCRLRVQGTAGALALAAEDGPQRFVLVLEPGRRAVLYGGEKQAVLLERPLEIRFRRSPLDIQFGLVDQQVLLAVEGRTIIRQAYERWPGTRESTLRPLAIGARGLTVVLEHLRVWRDLYYLDPRGLSRPWDDPSGGEPRGLFLLGDNPPVSVDSRHWQPSRVALGNVLGRVYPVFWAARHP